MAFLLVSALGLALFSAQEPAAHAQDLVDPPTVTISQEPVVVATATTPPLYVSFTEPSTAMNDRASVLSIVGGGFTQSSAVRLVGYGVLTTTFVNAGALTSALPAGIPPGTYAIEIIDPVGGIATAPGSLTILAPTGVPTAIFTLSPPLPEPTLLPTNMPPTVAPGQPSLVVRSFTFSPDTIVPGDTVSLRFEVVNQGDRPALGVSASLDASERFAAWGGRASVTLPDLPVGGAAIVTLQVVAGATTAAGANAVPLTFRFRDFEGKTYENKASVSVMVEAQTDVPRVSLARYRIDPANPAAGTLVDVELLITNVGRRAAQQAFVQITGEDGALLPGEQGDTFSLGDIAPGASVGLTVPMVVRQPTGESVVYGARPQAIKLFWLDGGDTKEATGTITVSVAPPRSVEPLLLLSEYAADPTESGILRPGQRFNLTIHLANRGAGDASEMLVTFDEVAPSQSDSSGTPSPGQSGGGGSGVFATLNTGSTIYQDALDTGETAMFSQTFMVSGNASSGIYSQPVTVRYRTRAGATKTDTFRVSLIVEALPRIQTRLTVPLPDPAVVGEPFPSRWKWRTSAPKRSISPACA
ncbi:MAG: hypothetical protein IPK19_37355 [Chloroflexi bacterium]|nr:hypothetical protein [Chloroflexota bacterium]